MRVWSVLGRAGLLIFLGGAALDGVGLAEGEPSSPSTPPPGEIPPEEVDLHVPNTLYVDGPDDIALEDMSPAEQEAILDIGERSNLGAAVHSAWSSATHTITAGARVERAAHAAGATGLDAIGVEP